MPLSSLNSSEAMASEQNVRQYLAYWLQLGKKVLIRNGQEALQPSPVIEGDHYSAEFEDCWRIVRSPESGDCYLEGTDQTISELLSPQWEINGCSRCTMPVPTRSVGMPPDNCPCFDLPSWPDTENPQPREPISSQTLLGQIRDRLNRTSGS